MPTLQDTYQEFSSSLIASRALYSHCLSPVGLHTEAGIEAAFLQTQKSWELFLENFLLLVLIGQRPILNTINCYFTVADIEVARKIMLQGRPYVEWTNRDWVLKRFEAFVAGPNHIESVLNSISVELAEIVTIRNCIAHSSKSAREAFENLWQRKVGGNPTITTAANFLQLPDPQNPPDTYFDRYAIILDIAASSMVS
jgi:hypothetical protein